MVFGFLVAGAAFAHDIDLGVPDPGVLPTSPFYFVKEWRRGITRLFTFNPIKKAELELTILNEKAAEAQEVEETSGDNIEAVKAALENYRDAHDRLETRLRALKETSENPNVDKLLSNLAEKTIKHEKLFADLDEKFKDKEEIKEIIEKTKEKLEKVVSEAARKEKDSLEKFSERFKKEIEKEGDDDETLAESSAHQIKEASEKIAELEKKIAETGNASENVAKLLAQAKAHLAKAETALKAQDFGEAFGQARSAETLARNGLRVLGDEKEVAEKKDDGKNNDDNDKRGETERPTISNVSEVRVTVDESGNFDPKEARVKKGGKVTWVNKGSRAAWPASAMHPTHLIYPEFDARKGIGPGESYSFKFEKAGSWKYHDHLNPSSFGAVNVAE